MATKTKAKSASEKSSAPVKRTKDACDLLDADHKAVKAMFKEYAALVESGGRSSAKKRELADKICNELTVHTAIEDEIFYPAVRKAIKDDALMNEAIVEHDSAKDLIAQIQEMDAKDEMFDAKVTVLGEYIDHHVKEERNEMFVQARASKLDLVKMAEQLKLRKEALMEAHDNNHAAKSVLEKAAAL